MKATDLLAEIAAGDELLKRGCRPVNCIPCGEFGLNLACPCCGGLGFEWVLPDNYRPGEPAAVEFVSYEQHIINSANKTWANQDSPTEQANPGTPQSPDEA